MMWLRDKTYLFIDEGEYKENTRLRYSRLLTALGRYEQEQKTPVYKFTAIQMHTAFVKVTKNYQTRQTLRYLLNSYFDWLEKQGENTQTGRLSLQTITDNVLQQDQGRYYFYGIEDLLQKLMLDLDYVARNDFTDPKGYRLEMTTFILTWYGFQLKDISALKKEDVLSTTNVIVYKDKQTKLHQSAWKQLREFADADYYLSKRGNGYARVPYMPSEYLMRTMLNDRIPPKNTSSVISQFNKKLPPDAKRYDLTSILWSGRFYRAWEMTKKNPGFFEGDLEEKIDLFNAIFDYKFKNKSQLQERISEFRSYISNLAK